MAYGFCQKCYKQKSRTKTTREKKKLLGGKIVRQFRRHPAGVTFYSNRKAEGRVVVQTQVKLSCGHYLVESQRSA